MADHRPVLITGAGGQLGRGLRALDLHAVFLQQDDLDITSKRQVLETVERVMPSAIINAAAFTKVDLAETEEAMAAEVNGIAVGHLAEAADIAGATLVHVSTDYVFDGRKKGPYLEDDDVAPISAYGRSKLAGEEAAKSADSHLLVRTSWVFGDGPNFIRSILKAALAHDELEVVNDQVGRPTHAGDLAKGIVDLLQHGAQGTYHLTGLGEPASWAEVAETALAAAGSDTNVKQVSTDHFFSSRQGPIAPRPANSVLDCRKAAELGVKLRPWKAAVVDYVKSGSAVSP